ncbi:fatty acyl-AMP ligase [Streptomyces tagetis]|uniref:Fatty acyl-AMP ligase n=1 Tax=Streptomyces tagetis TaxID=2820809 RepID=A0A941B6N8_9ACTN|nr:fatty acyl-AMP ligase [Streptomyces sp. RG38]MBQ0826573.1 fatty acyl-AMP ligase [Streptomyces sp. RG38]
MTAIATPFPTVWHALLAEAERDPAGSRLTLLPEPDVAEEVGYAALVENAARCAAALAEHGVGHGDRVLLCLPTGAEFLTAFFGTQVLGAAPTAIALPLRLGGTAGFEGRLKDLLGYLRPAAVVTTAAVIAALPRLTDVPLVDGAVLQARATAADAPRHPLRRPDGAETALIQCTSGSTGRPKGVVVSHANLAANCAQLTGAVGWTRADTTVSWAPLYHDMGLITGVLCPVFVGGNTVLMPPTRFLRAPAEWLRHLSAYRGAVAAAPNFAYGYVTSRVRDEELDGVDLSCWRMAFCGAEPIQPATVRRFVDRFTRWGLPAHAFTPGYGMAEATLVLTTKRLGTPFTYDSIDRQAAVTGARAVDVAPESPRAVQVVDCGEPVAGTEIRIVDDAGTPLEEDRIGHIQFRGPSRTAGYFALPEESAASVAAPDWWKTGDVGYLRDGGLRITSRARDLVIIRGANHFPSDFEQAAETVPGVRLGAVVAVGHRPEGADSEELHLIVETELGPEHHPELRRAVAGAVGSRTGVSPAAVHLVPRRGIPKTTSGKLQRARARELFVVRPGLAGSDGA